MSGPLYNPASAINPYGLMAAADYLLLHGLSDVIAGKLGLHAKADTAAFADLANVAYYADAADGANFADTDGNGRSLTTLLDAASALNAARLTGIVSLDRLPTLPYVSTDGGEVNGNLVIDNNLILGGAIYADGKDPSIEFDSTTGYLRDDGLTSLSWQYSVVTIPQTLAIGYQIKAATFGDDIAVNSPLVMSGNRVGLAASGDTANYLTSQVVTLSSVGGINFQTLGSDGSFALGSDGLLYGNGGGLSNLQYANEAGYANSADNSYYATIAQYDANYRDLTGLLDASSPLAAANLTGAAGSLAFGGYVTGANYKTFCVATLPSTQVVPTLGFTTVGLTKVVDPSNCFSNSTHFYIVPTAGIYAIFTKMRPADGGGTAGVSYGQGAGTSGSVDGSSFVWTTGNGYREGLVNFRIMSCAAGDQIRMYTYIDATAGGSIVYAEMNVLLLAKA